MQTDTLFQTLRLEGITKRFGANLALDAVDFDLRPGEVHALVGENGAGKSTLMHILAGIYTAYDGVYHLDGAALELTSPSDALAAGIGMIHQELSVIPDLSVAENLSIGRMPRNRFGAVNWQAVNARATARLTDVGLGHINVRQPLGRHPLGIQQIIEILRVVDSGARVLIMDEPTSALSPAEIETLMNIIDGLRTQGRGIIYISHFIDEVLRTSDRVTVLRDGKKIDTVNTSDTDAQSIISMILGRATTQSDRVTAHLAYDDLLLKVDGLSGDQFADVSFDVGAGEVIGLYGAIGAGHFELAKAVFGVEPTRAGQITLRGKPLPKSFDTTLAVKRGLAYATESRRQSLFLEDAIYKNVTLPHLREICGQRPRQSVEVDSANTVTARTNMQPPDTLQNVGNLSGGNQQKAAIARWLTVMPQVLIVSEPTRGMDIGAKQDVLGILRELSAAGIAILVVSSEPETVQALSNRILTMSRGRITAEVRPENYSNDNLLRLVST